MRAAVLTLILCLALPVRAAIEFGRTADHLTASEHGWYERGGVTVTVEDSIRLFAQTRYDDDVYRWASFEQFADGRVEVSTCRAYGHEAGVVTYASFADAIESPDADVIADLLDAVGEGRVLCSRRFIRLRDGAEDFDPGDEFECAAGHWLDLLDATDWRIRQEATDRLIEMGDDAAIWLSGVDWEDLTPEQAARVAGILRLYPK